MPRHQSKITINNSQDNKSPLEPSYPTPKGPEHVNTAEAQEKDFKTNFMKMTETLTEESQENTGIEIKLFNT